MNLLYVRVSERVGRNTTRRSCRYEGERRVGWEITAIGIYSSVNRLLECVGKVGGMALEQSEGIRLACDLS